MSFCTLLTAASAAALALAGVVAVPDGNAEAVQQTVTYTGGTTYTAGETAGLLDSAALSSPAVARGVVTSAEGALVKGAPVVLVAWPSDEVLSSLAIGEEFTLQPIARTTSAVNGSYALWVPTHASLMPYVNRDGQLVTLQVYVGDISETAPYGLSIRLGSSDSGSSTSISCTSSVVDRYKGSVILGIQFSRSDAAEMNFTFTSAAETVLGWGYSVSGSKGSFSQKGTRAVSSTESMSFRTRRGQGTFFRSGTVVYTKYKIGCSAYTGGPKKYTYNVFASPGFGAPTGAKLGPEHAPNPPAINCAPIERGGSLTKENATSVTWSNGVDLTTTNIGGEFSSQAGFTKNAAHTYKNASTSEKQICGSSGNYCDEPRVLVFKKTA